MATVSLLPLNSISIHALREEGDPSGYYRGWFPEKFLSTPSARRATSGALRPRAVHRISIHALREEGDRATEVTHNTDKNYLKSTRLNSSHVTGSRMPPSA